MHDWEFDLFASWLCTTAREMGQSDAMRGLLRRAFDDAVAMYGLPLESDENEPDDITVVISRFAAAWDASEREALEDDVGERKELPPVESTIKAVQPSDGVAAQSKRDRCGYENGSLAARINEILTGPALQSDAEVHAKLVHDFSAATKEQVYRHIRHLRRRLREIHSTMLEERRKDGIWTFRLKP